MPDGQFFTVSQMKRLNLFDDIPYKIVKEYKDDDNVDVEWITWWLGGPNRVGGPSRKESTFSFKLNNRRYEVVKEYGAWSAYDIRHNEVFKEILDSDDEADATTIQALVRGVLTRRKIQATTIQALTRGVLTRRQMDRKAIDATTIQALARGVLTRKKMQMDRKAIERLLFKHCHEMNSLALKLQAYRKV